MGAVIFAVAGCASGVQDGSDGGFTFGPTPGSPGPAGDDGSGDGGSEGDDGSGDGVGTGDDGVGTGDDGGESDDGMLPSGTCNVGESEMCFSGPAAAAGVGACVMGSSSCEGGMWGACAGEVLPGVESCNGIDDDCDGTVDAPLADTGADCATGMPGVCGSGTTSCVSGQSVCEPVTAASAEQCDGLDNDCNGQADDGNPGGGGACNTGLSGICGAGTNTCTGGAIACQQNQQAAGSETCNDGLDNNCNGQVDENCSSCTHDICVIGIALVNGCEPCVTQICAADSYCCNNSWDSICVGEVGSICGIIC